MSWITARNRKESGQALVLFVLGFGVLAGMAAMAIDIGMFLHERRSLQNAADAAALAAAQELPGTPPTIKAAAYAWAAANGYADAEGDDYVDSDDDADGSEVTVTFPYNGDLTKVEVVIKKDVPAMFARVLGRDAFPAQARAVATRGIAGAKGYGILVLNKTACSAFEKSGAGGLSVTNGGAIVVNSDCDEAMKFGGSGPVEAGAINYYSPGGWIQNGQGEISPTPEPMADRLPDPMVGVPPPNLVTLGQSLDSAGTALTPKTRKVINGNNVLRPGVYYGGLAIQSTANVVFEPGIYVMAGGGLELTGNGTVTGNGIFIYNTFDPQNQSGDGACKSINLRGGADFTLTAPTSGRYANILFWQDVACSAPFIHDGNGDLTGGVIYVPGAEIQFRGTGDIAPKQIIADTVDVSGNADITVNFEPYLSGLFGTVRLIE